MAEGNGAGNGNKQLIGWVVTALAAAVMVLFQYAIMSRLDLLDARIWVIASDVSSLKTGRTNDQNEIDELRRELELAKAGARR